MKRIICRCLIATVGPQRKACMNGKNQMRQASVTDAAGIKRSLIKAVAALLCVGLFCGCVAGQAVDLGQTDDVEQAAGVKSATGSENNVTGDKTYMKQDGIEVIYLAGGCFWGMEKLAETLPGVRSAVSGYANGSIENPSYSQVCNGGTGFRETVRVEYDPSEITLEQILSAYFLVIDPTVENQQGADRGAQYQTGIYYADEASGAVVERIAAQEAKRYDVFMVEHGPLLNFYDAEEYHQNYLEKNPDGYCHIPRTEMDAVAAIIAAERSYTKPADDKLEEALTQEQYDVTQNAGTERAFTGEYWDKHDEGVYVDVTTGQPLFSSLDKYDSECGWPSFTAPILAGSVQYGDDYSYGMTREEVTASNGNTHLGHVFESDSESPNGIRYCINSASLRFVPKEQMVAQGYGTYLLLFD